jgi:hypothetical protein
LVRDEGIMQWGTVGLIVYCSVAVTVAVLWWSFRTGIDEQ